MKCVPVDAFADQVVRASVLLLKRVCRRWSEELEYMPNFELEMVSLRRNVSFPLHQKVSDRTRRVGVRQIIAGTRYSQVRALAVVSCTVSIF